MSESEWTAVPDTISQAAPTKVAAPVPAPPAPSSTSAPTHGRAGASAPSASAPAPAGPAARSLPPPSGSPEKAATTYRRYHIDSLLAPNIVPHPHRFKVKVSKVGLTKLLVTELLHYRFNREVVLSRPCLYGVFSGPVGGFAPREAKCVGCLRCTTQYPDMVRILPSPDRERQGDAFYRPEFVDVVTYEAETGQVPVRGAGYRGKFGGEGWDGMWTDMSEIVRPTRDGIHGREFISTVVDIGSSPPHLSFDASGEPTGAVPKGFRLPVPFLFDLPPATVRTAKLMRALAQAAREIGSLVVVPVADVPALLDAEAGFGPQLVPLVDVPTGLVDLPTGLGDAPADNDSRPSHQTPIDPSGEPLAHRSQLLSLGYVPRLVELTAWDADLAAAIQAKWPTTIVALRLNAGADLEARIREAVQAGVRVLHVVSDLHGRGSDGRFVLDLIRAAHLTLVELGRRNEVTLIGSGGMVAAEHVPKAILCGLDLVGIDTPALVALQARFQGECRDRELSRFVMPDYDAAWGVQRLKNLAAAWRDQLLEIMGAMGLREVRRLRGEMGRAMFQKDLEREAFGDILGFEA